jgi:hypothetical protein
MPVVPGVNPRAAAVALRSGVLTAEIALNGDLTTATDQPIIGLRIIADPGDDVTAANALLTGAGCKVLLPGDCLTLELSAGIVALYMVGIGRAALPADYTGGSGVVSIAETDVADVYAQMIRLDFNSLDDVRSVTLSLSVWGSELVGRVFLEANSHA